METISRKAFIQHCLGLGTLAGLPFLPATAWAEERVDDDFYKKIVVANEQEVAKLLKSLTAEITEVRRRAGYDLSNLAAAFCETTSTFYQNEELIRGMSKIIRFLLKAQHTDGTLDFGNLASPPDTAFILEPLTAAATILKHTNQASLNDVKAQLKTFIVKAGEALRTGGVHTPNHRWVVSAALAKINALYPDTGYVKRIHEWLAEGVYIDDEGNYLERSMNYSVVIDRALITMASLLPMPSLFGPVRKNLDLVYVHCEPNGELVTVDSRRQDQYAPIGILNFYHEYRFMAIHDNKPEWAAITRYIETLPGFTDRVLNDLLAVFLEEPLYKKPLPTPKAPSVNFEVFYRHTNLVRIRRSDTTTTLFGGTDFPIIIASGRSNSPNFFSFRKGAAILKYMRLSTDFFSTGYFHSQGVRHEAGRYILHQKIEAPYYQPLPAQYRKANGDYAHSQSTDGRFWNKMDFSHRPQSNIKTLETTITAHETTGRNELTVRVTSEAGVHVTLELCFKEGGTLTGVSPQDGSADNFFLKNGMGQYTTGADTIQFGPGVYHHGKTTGLEGELYSSHFGSLRTTGMHVYLTGITPFEHTITIG
ncbi:hypothetical protein [Spirosoma aerolatum]|uniref:hypothetical protein n=1 Tax=Spirosoma aerolatum TaxID=1211326 RepID=UPI0009AC172C|nr:hypothetical protein [Spirosoma aerolatum]